MIKNAFGPNPKSVENTAVAYSSVPNNNNNFKSPKRNEVIIIDSINENEQTKRIIDFGNTGGADNMRQ
jgi:hypothetical protein